jgi:EpsI family protein
MSASRWFSFRKVPAQYWAVVLLLAATALLLHVRGDVDRVLPSRPLRELPMSFGARTAIDVAINPDSLQILGKGDFLNRMYSAPPPSPLSPANVGTTEKVGDIAPIGLFIGYFATQRTGQSIHSPQNCLPGAGWTFLESGVTELNGPVGKDGAEKKIRVGEYLIGNGGSTQEVLYWYQMHGRSIAGDYAAKMYTLADSIRYGRTDAALVRIITPVVPGEPRAEAHARAVAFAEQIVPLLPEYVPN